jgi:hypothetical protein
MVRIWERCVEGGWVEIERKSYLLRPYPVVFYTAC